MAQDKKVATMPGKPVPLVSEEAPVAPSLPCIIHQQPDGGIRVEFLIEPTMARRYKSRANHMPLERYLWENVLKPAISSGVY